MWTIEELKRMLEAGENEKIVEFLEKQEAGEEQFRSTILLLAAECGNMEVVRYLLTKGCDVNTKDEIGRTPLIVALEHRKNYIANVLLAIGHADVSISDSRQISALALAIANNVELLTFGNLLRESILQEQHAIAFALAIHLKFEIHQAVRVGLHANVIEVLIRTGKSVNTAHLPSGRTPLHWAIVEENAFLVKLLLTYGADTKQQDSAGCDSWDVVFQRNNLEILKIFLQNDQEFLRQLNPEGFLESHRAWRICNVQIISFLIQEQLLTPNGLFVQDRYGNGLLHYLALNKNSDVVRKVFARIIEYFDLNIYNKYGETPLHWAAKIGNEETLEVLLLRGANPDVTTYAHSLTPILAIYDIPSDKIIEGHIKCIELLLQYHADINIICVNNEGLDLDVLNLVCGRQAPIEQIKPLVARMALLKESNAHIINRITAKIDSHAILSNYLLECQNVLGLNIEKTDINIFNLMTDHRKQMVMNVANYPILRNIEVLSKLPIFEQMQQHHQFYYNTCVRRIIIANNDKEVQENAAKAIVTLGSHKFEDTSSVVNNILRYLNDRDLQQLHLYFTKLNH